MLRQPIAQHCRHCRDTMPSCSRISYDDVFRDAATLYATFALFLPSRRRAAARTPRFTLVMP